MAARTASESATVSSRARKALPSWLAWSMRAPSMIEALSEYATTVPCGCALCVSLIIANSDFSLRSPSITQSALKILWRQCSLLAWANIVNSTSVGLRWRPVNAVTR